MFFTKKEYIHNTLHLLIYNGWGFFVPLLLLYLVSWKLNLPISQIKILFVIVSIGFLFLAFVPFLSNLNRKNIGSYIFWMGLFLFFLLPGAYLEVPSDPWIHIRRIFHWDHHYLINGSWILKYKFAYFFGWTLLDWVPIIYRRIALDFYGAFWQILLAFQFYRFFRCLGLNNAWSYIQIIGVFFLFGTNLFGLRYYALSSTPLAYIAYLAALIVILEFLDQRRFAFKKLLSLAFLVLIIVYNHEQELYLLLISSGTLFLYLIFTKIRVPNRGKFLYGLAILYLVHLVLGGILYYQHMDAFMERGHEYLTFWGGIKFWDPSSPFFNTLGLHGFLGLLFCFFTLKKYPKLTCLCLAPVLVLLSPLSPWLMIHQNRLVHDTYRIFYVMPTSIVFIFGLYELLVAFSRRFSFPKGERKLIAVLLGIIVLVGLFPKFPIRGRLYFQLYIPPSERSFDKVDLTADWLANNRDYGPGCWIISDSATRVVLISHLGRMIERIRLDVRKFGLTVTNETLLKTLIKQYNICAVLVGIKQQIPTPPRSPIPIRSGHWHPIFSDLNSLISDKFESTTTTLEKWGWKKTFVPPFYNLYEPPYAVQWTMLDFDKGTQSGDGHLIQFPKGKYFLLNTGNFGRKTLNYLANSRIETLDKIIISRPVKDYYAGLETLAQSEIQVREILINLPDKTWCNKVPDTICNYKDLIRALELHSRKGARIRSLNKNKVFYEQGKTRFEVIAMIKTNSLDSSPKSPVISLKTTGKSLITLDSLDQNLEDFLIKNKDYLASDIIVLSAPSLFALPTIDLITMLNPNIILASASLSLWQGEENRPLKSALELDKILTLVNGRDGQVSLLFTKNGLGSFSATKGSGPYFDNTPGAAPGFLGDQTF